MDRNKPPKSGLPAAASWLIMALCIFAILFDTLLYANVISKFTLIFEEMGLDLPWLTAAVVGLSGFLLNTYYLPVLALIVVVIAKELVIKNRTLKGGINIGLLLSLVVLMVVSIVAVLLPMMLLMRSIEGG